MEQIDHRDRHIEAGSGVSLKRVLLATIGSLGDLYPCLALALELNRRGHTATIATTENYRAIVESLRIEFHPIRLGWDPTDPELIQLGDDLKRGDLKKGPEILFRKMILPNLKNTYSDLLQAAAKTDLMIAGELNFAAPLVAEKLGLRWVSAILSPASFLSAHDPAMLVNVPWLIHLRKAGWAVYRAGLNTGRLAIRHWWKPVRQLRREQKLRLNCDPIFHDKFSPDLVLALFSGALAKPQRDWPAQTLQTGFVWFAPPGKSADLDPRLRDFLDSGDPPIVFTQGSTAVNNPGNFYAVSVEAAARLRRRAVLLGASEELGSDSPRILVLRHAPYSQIFPRGSVNVHHGGSGTTGEALRAGRPQLIIPYGWDQPDNAVRVERLGTGIHLPRRQYSVDAAAVALRRLLGEPGFLDKATRVGAQIRAEDGLTSASDAIELKLMPQIHYRDGVDH